MMSTSSRWQAETSCPTSILPLGYRDVLILQTESELEMRCETPDGQLSMTSSQIGVSPEELESQVILARAEAIRETEARMQAELDRIRLHEHETIRRTLHDFAQSRTEYFAQVEAEVVRFALAIAARVLQHEVSVDPLALAAMVKVAIDKLQAGTRITLHVPEQDAERWSDLLKDSLPQAKINIVGDLELRTGDCSMQTELGIVDFGINEQLQDIEQTLFGLLSKRPAKE